MDWATTQKPSISDEFDRTHPILRDIVSWWPISDRSGDTIRDIINGYDLVSTNHESTDWTAHRGGSLDLNGDHFRKTDEAVFDFGSSAMSLSVWLMPHSVVSSGTVVLAKPGAQPGESWHGWQLLIDPDGTLRFSTDGGASAQDCNTRGLTNGEWHHVCVTRPSSGQYNIFVDGVECGYSSTTTASPNANTSDLSFGGASWQTGWGGNDDFNGRYDDFRFWLRELNQREILDLFQDQWAPFRRSAVVFARAPVVALTLTADVGAFTVTGVAAGLEPTRVVTGSTGAFTVTGQDAGMQATFSIPAGSYALAGQDAGLKAGRVLDATTAGSYTLSGQGATVSAGYAPAADTGSFTMTGIAAGLSFDPVTTIDAGSFVYTGVAADLVEELSGRVTADPGSFTFTGIDAGLSADFDVTAEAGSFILTGIAAALIAGYDLDCSAGSYVYIGKDVLSGTLRTKLFLEGLYVGSAL